MPTTSVCLVFGEPKLFRQMNTASELVLAIIPDGTEVKVHGRTEPWCEVSIVASGNASNGLRGFVMSAFVKERETTSLFFAEENPAQERPMTGLIQGLLNLVPDSKFGPATTRAVQEFQRNHSLPVTGVVDRATGEALGLTNWMDGKECRLDKPFSETGPRTVKFCALTPGGFFSHWVDLGGATHDPRTKRAVRTNNPGALNSSTWRKSFPGYVGLTKPDASVDANVTMIFSSPEYGVAAWRYWFYRRFGRRTEATLAEVIQAYRGVGGPSAEGYLSGYSRFSHGQITAARPIRFDNEEDMFQLARAAYSHEAGFWFPLTDEQFRAGIKLGTREIAKESGQGIVASARRSAGEVLVRVGDALSSRVRK